MRIIPQRHGDHQAPSGLQQRPTSSNGGENFPVGLARSIVIKANVLEGGEGKDEGKPQVGLPRNDILVDDAFGFFKLIQNGVLIHAIVAEHVADLQHRPVDLLQIPAAERDFHATLVAPGNIVICKMTGQQPVTILEVTRGEKRQDER